MTVMCEELNQREEFHGFGGVGWELNWDVGVLGDIVGLGFGVGAEWVVAEFGEVEFLLFIDHAGEDESFLSESVEHEDDVVGFPAVEDEDFLVIEFLDHLIDRNWVVDDFVADFLLRKVEQERIAQDFIDRVDWLELWTVAVTAGRGANDDYIWQVVRCEQLLLVFCRWGFADHAQVQKWIYFHRGDHRLRVLVLER